MVSKAFLVVGGGFGQLPAISAARELGLDAVVVDRDPGAVGIRDAHVGMAVDVVDVEGVIAVAREHNVIGAMTMQSDIGVPTVGAVVDALGLPGLSRAVADRCSNKILLRQAFESAGVPQPRFLVVSALEDAVDAAREIGFPCVLKAPDSSGSRGVIKVNSPASIESAFREALLHTNGPELLVEEFIEGIELGAQAFSRDGSCEVVLAHDDVVSDPPYMVPIAHAFPSSLDPSSERLVVDAVRRCVEALGIHAGPSNIDLILADSGVPKIIEVGARIGATCLPELVHCFTGIDWVKASVLAAIGGHASLASTASQPCAAFILQSPSDGKFRSARIPHHWTEHPDVVEWELTVAPGDVVSRLTKGTDRIGKVMARGSSSAIALDLAKSFRDAVEYDIQHA